MTTAVRPSLRHEALRYSGADAFTRLVTTLFGAGLRAGDACALLAAGGRIDAARSALGADSAEVSYVDMSVAGRNPARVLPAMQHLVDTHPGRRLRWLAVPTDVGLPASMTAEMTMHEHLLDLPSVARWDGTVRCLYDPDEIGPDVAAEIERRHRTLPVENTDAALRQAMSEPLPTPPPAAETKPVDLTTLGPLRDFVRARADSAALTAERTDDLVYAVNEIVTNSICHGEGRARVSVWTEGPAVVCEVRDRGRIHDPLVGRVAPKPGQVTGRGIWLVNHLCDLVQLRSSDWGTAVRMHVRN